MLLSQSYSAFSYLVCVDSTHISSKTLWQLKRNWNMSMTLCQYLHTLTDAALLIGKKSFVGQKWIILACTTPCTSSAKTRLNLTNWGKKKVMKFCQVKCWNPLVRYTTHPLPVKDQFSRKIVKSSRTVCPNGNWQVQSEISGEERKVSEESPQRRARVDRRRLRNLDKTSTSCRKRSWSRGCKMQTLRMKEVKMSEK